MCRIVCYSLLNFIELYTHHTMIPVCPQSRCCGIYRVVKKTDTRFNF